MTLERAKYILSKKIDFIKENWENENTFNYYWTEEDIEAIEIIFIALENDKNAFIKQVEITREANTLYEEEKEKNIKLEEQHKIDENSVIDLITQLNDENERCRDLSVELDEVNKIINLMAEEILNLDIKMSKDRYDNARVWDTKEGIKEYYFNKAKDDKK